MTNRHHGYSGARQHANDDCGPDLRWRVLRIIFTVMAVAHFYNLATHHI